MSDLSTKEQKINKLTECSICCEVFTDPTVLPCIHTFCLKCLEQYGTGKNPGDKVPCPICRRYFAVPNGGFKHLQQNFFIRNLIEINKFVASAAMEELKCGICIDQGNGKDSVTAAKYCLDCKHGLCELCLKEHGKHCKSHKIVSVGEEVRNVKTFRANYCDQHKMEELKYYCFDCKVTICVTCFVEKHKSHKCSDFVNVVVDLHQQMETDLEKLEEKIAIENGKGKQIQTEKEIFLEYLLDLKSKVHSKLNNFKIFLNEQAQKLYEEIDTIQGDKIRDVEIIQKEINGNMDIMEGFLKYYKEVMDKASACDVACSAKDLHTRTNELLKTKIKWNSNLLKGLEFFPLKEEDLLNDKRPNLIGKIQVEEKNLIQVDREENKFSIELTLLDMFKKGEHFSRSQWFGLFIVIFALMLFFFGCPNNFMQILSGKEFNTSQLMEHKFKVETEIKTKKLNDSIANLAHMFPLEGTVWDQLRENTLQTITNVDEGNSFLPILFVSQYYTDNYGRSNGINSWKECECLAKQFLTAIKQSFGLEKQHVAIDQKTVPVPSTDVENTNRIVNDLMLNTLENKTKIALVSNVLVFPLTALVTLQWFQRHVASTNKTNGILVMTTTGANVLYGTHANSVRDILIDKFSTWMISDEIKKRLDEIIVVSVPNVFTRSKVLQHTVCDVEFIKLLQRNL